jgi:hypothetical protein
MFEVQIAANTGAVRLVQADLNRTPHLGGFVTQGQPTKNGSLRHSPGAQNVAGRSPVAITIRIAIPAA